MELALYCPDYGYYEKDLYSTGRNGDFYTSVSVGSLFGELLAFQFDDWASNAREICAIELIEVGAHDGALAKDILGWLSTYRSLFFAKLDYCILESSKRRQAAQKQKLSEFVSRVTWLPGIEALPATQPHTFRIIFSNEFLDALPVHKLGWDTASKEWFEWGVTMKDEKFVWHPIHPDKGTRRLISQLLPTDPELLAALPNGFITEICPLAMEWWRRAATKLSTGKLLTLDYGLTAENLLAPERTAGTLRAYRNHRMTENVLGCPGDQDLTAHVNFDALQRIGEECGLHTELLSSQEQFLGRIAARLMSSSVNPGVWSAQKIRELHTLTHPDFLGRRFLAIVQSTKSI